MVMQHVLMLIIDGTRTISAHAAEVQVVELLAERAHAAVICILSNGVTCAIRVRMTMVVASSRDAARREAARKASA